MNIIDYKQLKTARLTATTTPKNLFDFIEESNPGFKLSIKDKAVQLNSLRIYMHSVLAGFRFDRQMSLQMIKF